MFTSLKSAIDERDFERPIADMCLMLVGNTKNKLKVNLFEMDNKKYTTKRFKLYIPDIVKIITENDFVDPYYNNNVLSKDKDVTLFIVEEISFSKRLKIQDLKNIIVGHLSYGYIYSKNNNNSKFIRLLLRIEPLTYLSDENNHSDTFTIDILTGFNNDVKEIYDNIIVETLSIDNNKYQLIKDFSKDLLNKIMNIELEGKLVSEIIKGNFEYTENKILSEKFVRLHKVIGDMINININDAMFDKSLDELYSDIHDRDDIGVFVSNLDLLQTIYSMDNNSNSYNEIISIVAERIKDKYLQKLIQHTTDSIHTILQNILNNVNNFINEHDINTAKFLEYINLVSKTIEYSINKDIIDDEDGSNIPYNYKYYIINMIGLLNVTIKEFLKRYNVENKTSVNEIYESIKSIIDNFSKNLSEHIIFYRLFMNDLVIKERIGASNNYIRSNIHILNLDIRNLVSIYEETNFDKTYIDFIKHIIRHKPYKLKIIDKEDVYKLIKLDDEYINKYFDDIRRFNHNVMDLFKSLIDVLNFSYTKIIDDNYFKEETKSFLLNTTESYIKSSLQIIQDSIDLLKPIVDELINRIDKVEAVIIPSDIDNQKSSNFDIKLYMLTRYVTDIYGVSDIVKLYIGRLICFWKLIEGKNKKITINSELYIFDQEMFSVFVDKSIVDDTHKIHKIEINTNEINGKLLLENLINLFNSIYRDNSQFSRLLEMVNNEYLKLLLTEDINDTE